MIWAFAILLSTQQFACMLSMHLGRSFAQSILQWFPFHYILFTLCFTASAHLWESFATAYQNSLQTDLAIVHPQAFPSVLPASLCLSQMHLSPLVTINTPHPLHFKNVISIDLVTYIHITTLPSLPQSLSSFYLWSDWSLFHLHLSVSIPSIICSLSAPLS